MISGYEYLIIRKGSKQGRGSFFGIVLYAKFPVCVCVCVCVTKASGEQPESIRLHLNISILLEIFIRIVPREKAKKRQRE